MDHSEVGAYWEKNAQAWTVMSREGYDVCRDGFNTPRFLEMMPSIKGLHGLDIGCGEGANTRRIARLGAKMTAIDIAPTFIRHAKNAEQAEPLGICYEQASAVELPFGDSTFDFAVSFMCLMDMAESDRAMAEALRVIRPGGFFQFSIIHPCWGPPHRRVVREAGKPLAVDLARYWENCDGEVEQWTFGAAPEQMRERFEKFRVPRFHRTLSWWINTLIETGFTVQRVQEPRPNDDDVARYPSLRDEQQVPLFIHFLVCKKAAESR